ncbi:MAG: hypothetical protein Q7J34_11160 [Bacteroidales bacterium]|jgi:regulator of replication initiation timing|nr:hypothetical protein [Bacteroidales bacterium]
MEELSRIIISIEEKLKGIMFENHALTVRNAALIRQISELQEKNGVKENTIDRMAEKLKLITITNTVSKGKETVDAKQKINEIVREIDRCIRLINS